MPTDFWSGVVVALVVGVIANLITPLTRAALTAAVVRLGVALNALGYWGIRTALANSEKELALLQEVHADPIKLTVLLSDHLAWNLVLIWTLLFGFGVVLMFGLDSHPNVKIWFFGFLGASTSTVASLFVMQAVLSKLKSFADYKARTEKRIASFRAALALAGKANGGG